jgi:NAD(P)H-flavin reductase
MNTQLNASQKSQQAHPRLYTAIFEDKQQLSHRFSHLHFELKQPHRLIFQAGQYVQWQLPGAAQDSTAAVSQQQKSFIISDPDVKHGIEILLDKAAETTLSQYLQQLEFGQQVQFQAPLGDFMIQSRTEPREAQVKSKEAAVAEQKAQAAPQEPKITSASHCFGCPHAMRCAQAQQTQVASQVEPVQSSQSVPSSQDQSGQVGQTEQALALVGQTAGIAPLHSMLLDQLTNKQDQRPITLYWALTQERDLFWEDDLSRLSQDYPNFNFHPVLAQAGEQWPLCRGQLTDCLDTHQLAPHTGFYICAKQQQIAALEQVLLRREVNSSFIHSCALT